MRPGGLVLRRPNGTVLSGTTPQQCFGQPRRTSRGTVSPWRSEGLGARQCSPAGGSGTSLPDTPGCWSNPIRAGGEGSAARQRGEMEPPAPIGSAVPQRAATARASAAGNCFDRDARIPRRPPTPPSRRSTRRLLLLTRGYPAGPLRPTRPPRILLSCGGCFDRTRGYLARPPRPRPNDSASFAAPCSSSRRERAGLPSMAALGRGAPHPRPLPQGVRHPMVLTGQAASCSRSWRCAQAVASS